MTDSKHGDKEIINTDNYDKIGVITSPSGTADISLEILEEPSRTNLIGKLIWYKFMQDKCPHYALGQITEILLKNFMLEFSEMRSLARQRGQVNPITEVQDTHQGIMTTGAVFKHNGNTFEPSVLGTVPPTGTLAFNAKNELIEKLLEDYKNPISYLGNFYLSETKLPLTFPHFGDPNSGGAGEAYHIGIYGMTGSAKSTLAKMIISCYAKHQDMTIFIFDPAGEFTKAAKGKKGNEVFFVNLKEVFSSMGKDVIMKDIQNLSLDRWEQFVEILYQSHFFQTFQIPKNANRRTACEILEREFRHNGITLSKLSQRSSFDSAMDVLSNPQIQNEIYTTPARARRISQAIERIDHDTLFDDWKPLAELFNSDDSNRTSVRDLLSQIFNPNYGVTKPVVIVDISNESAPEKIFWSNTIKAMIIKSILAILVKSGQDAFNKGRFLNTLVLLDEAQKLVPREKKENTTEEEVRERLISAVETTRKYGLGWMFLSTSLSTLHKEIYRQNRISFYGFGLSSGSEMDDLRQLINNTNAIKLYQSFQDPHSAFNMSGRNYSFMTRGPVSPLSFSGSPLFLTLFKTPDEFNKANDFL